MSETMRLTCTKDHAALRAYVVRPDYSHSTVRDPGTIWEDVIWLYRYDSLSPTGVKLADDAPSADARCEECCSITRPHCGPTRGSASEVR